MTSEPAREAVGVLRDEPEAPFALDVDNASRTVAKAAIVGGLSYVAAVGAAAV